jgi:pimeloyl-ACP methyl ester carboxylesterase
MKPPILFIHGAFTRAQRWRPWLAYFQQAGFECVAPSLPAHDPPDPMALKRLDFDDYVQAIREVHGRFDRPPVIIGHSMGGLIAQHVAATTDCAGLVLIASMAPWRMGTTRRAMPHMLDYVLPVATGRPVRVNLRSAMNLVLHDMTPSEQQEVISMFAYESGRVYRTMVLGRAPIRKGAVRCPVLVVSGGADRLLRRSVASDLTAFYGAKHIAVPGRGHGLVAESLIDAVAARVRQWIERLPERQGAHDHASDPSFTSSAAV